MTRNEINAFVAMVLIMGGCMVAAVVLLWLLSLVGLVRWW